ncbi:MAG: CSLREA domain-containing protein [Solirubrobacterales bacterium]
MGTAIGISAAAAAAGSAQAADITVTTTADSGAGSLREAIHTANLTPATSDRILFQSGLSGTISPLIALPALEGPTEIEGPGMDQMKIDARGLFRVLESTSDTSVSSLTLANGTAGESQEGGGIFVDSGDLEVEETRIEGGKAEFSNGGGIALKNGNLSLSNSVITGNLAGFGGGIALTDAGLTMTGTTISENRAVGSGGGVTVQNEFDDPTPSSVSIASSSFTDNRAFSGGGLQVSGPPTSIDSTLFSGNSASYESGAISVLASGSSVISNSTITGNKASVFGGGIFAFAQGGFTIESSTITGNSIFAPINESLGGAGIITGGEPLTLNNSIVSANEPVDISTAPSPSPGIPGGVVNSSFSLTGPSAGANLADAVPGSNITSSDPQLGPLADNGGPTMTMLPAETSPVVNKGSSPLPVDQRGLIRPVNFNSIPFSTATGANGADIGAVELQEVPPIPPISPSNKFNFGKVKLNKKKGVATLQVKVPGAGKVLLLGSKTVAKSSKKSKKKSTLKLTVKAKGKAAKTLKKKGKAKVKAKVKFTPTGGKAKTKSKTVKLIKKKKKK